MTQGAAVTLVPQSVPSIKPAPGFNVLYNLFPAPNPAQPNQESFLAAMVAKNPYNLPENTERDVDQLTYNPRAEAGHDNAAFDPDRDSESAQPLGARGADNQSTGRNFAQEDMETERSEQTGQIPKGTCFPAPLESLR